MATRTSKSANAGRPRSNVAKSTVQGAAGGFTPKRRGTSGTTISTARSTQARSTKSATGARRPTGRSVEEPPDAAPESGECARAVVYDLTKFPPDVGRSALAMSCLALAREIDNPFNSATSKSMCARSLLETWFRLRELMPAEAEKDSLDDLARRRAARISGHPAS